MTPVETVVRFFHDVDRRDWDAVRAALADDVGTDYTSLFGGEAEEVAAGDLVARWRGLLPGFDATQHLLGPLTPAAGVAADVVRLECNVRGYHRLGGAEWMVAGRYEIGVADPGATPRIAAITLHTSYERATAPWWNARRNEPRSTPGPTPRGTAPSRPARGTRPTAAAAAGPPRPTRRGPAPSTPGRGAGRTNASDVVGRTRSGSAPTPAKTARARPNHVVAPVDVAW